MVLSPHYIDANWVLHKRILNFSFMPPPYNGVSLAEKMLLLLKDWGFDKTVMCLTVDNASLNNLCVDIMKVQLKFLCNGDYFHVRCCAHILNLIVEEGLKDVDDVVFKVRSALSIVKGLKSENKGSLSLASFVIMIIIKGYVKMSQQDGILFIICLKVPFITRKSLVIWRLLTVISSIVQE